MSKHLDRTKERGPVIACGASAIYLDHDPEEPTNVDKLVGVLMRLARVVRLSERSASVRKLQSQGHDVVAPTTSA